MNAINKFLAVSAFAIGAAVPLTGFAQANMDHSKMTMPQATSMTTGEVRKIDKDAVVHSIEDLASLERAVEILG